MVALVAIACVITTVCAINGDATTAMGSATLCRFITPSGVIPSATIPSGVARSIVIPNGAIFSSLILGGISVLPSQIDTRAIAANSVKVREPLASQDLGLGQPLSVKGRGNRLLRQIIGHVGAVDSRVDEGRNTPELSVHRQRGVGAQGGHVDLEGVEVLLRGDQRDGGVHDGLVRAELVDDLVRHGELDRFRSCQQISSHTRTHAHTKPHGVMGVWESRLSSYLFTRVCATEESPGDASSNGGCDSWITEAGISQLADGVDGDLFLAEASVGDSHKSCKRHSFGDGHGGLPER